LVLSVVVLSAVACVPASTNPDGSVPQNPPLSLHGVVAEGASLWGADLLGGQLVRFDPATGVISERYGPAEGVCRVDDVAVLPGGDLAATCPNQGLVIRVERGGDASVLAAVGSGVNPIVLDPSGTSVLVGFTFGGEDRLLRVPLDGGPVTTAASGLPPLAGFDLDDDGTIVAPTGGLDGGFGTGGLVRIDPTDGTATTLPLTFPAEPSRTGLDLAVAAAVGADGTIYVAQALDPTVYAVDPLTGMATSIGYSPVGAADNIASLADGRVVLSGLTGGAVGVFTPTGSTWTVTVRPVGS
jgi:streptogramin lyase